MSTNFNGNIVNNFYYNNEKVEKVYYNGNLMYFAHIVSLPRITAVTWRYTATISIPSLIQNNVYTTSNKITILKGNEYIEKNAVVNGTVTFVLEDRWGNDESNWQEYCDIKITFTSGKITKIENYIYCYVDQTSDYPWYSAGGYDATILFI